MIDIHSHILPGVDDGAKSIEDSLQMARMAVIEGIHKIIATPHHMNGKYENRKEDIIARVATLNEVLQAQAIPLEILPGQETRIYGEMLKDYKLEEIVTLNDGGKYLFIELPSAHVPRYTEQLLSDIQFERLTPIIVHPERNQELIENPDLLYKLVNNGTLTQVTAASVSGAFGKAIQKFSMQLIEANLTHFVSSDAHNITNRSFKMNEAYDAIEKKYSVDYVNLFLDNAELLVEGKSIYKEVPEKIKKKKFLGVF
ncbi:tyrosine protein phosphatase [Peribacillus muralis]|uniref:tyrosine-protein phosphatase n=1 Tax=Peribacillus muralis TaxID=264697 RepID=UPI001F4D77EE|nr:CpsB/CapC family capsule biosynthesis tyrosine phosphatase [Peribacillus muralis]MCK1991642.1 tyrosine protein phosphatase [Peribacillus muralis]MCK2012201.1 tyrosine protein phosphatase [Peribacillus muralis]